MCAFPMVNLNYRIPLKQNFPKRKTWRLAQDYSKNYLLELRWLVDQQEIKWSLFFFFNWVAVSVIFMRTHSLVPASQMHTRCCFSLSNVIISWKCVVFKQLVRQNKTFKYVTIGPLKWCLTFYLEKLNWLIEKISSRLISN